MDEKFTYHYNTILSYYILLKEYFGQLKSILLSAFSTFITIAPHLSYLLLCSSAQYDPTHKKECISLKS